MYASYSDRSTWTCDMSKLSHRIFFNKISVTSVDTLFERRWSASYRSCFLYKTRKLSLLHVKCFCVPDYKLASTHFIGHSSFGNYNKTGTHVIAALLLTNVSLGKVKRQENVITVSEIWSSEVSSARCYQSGSIKQSWCLFMCPSLRLSVPYPYLNKKLSKCWASAICEPLDALFSNR